jgi:hypothetical protein
MRPETVTQPDAERAIATEALVFRKRVTVRDTTTREFFKAQRAPTERI